MFSKACEYALKAVIFIASQSQSGQKTGIRQICDSIETPHHFTAKILQNLSRQGLVKSSKGPTGGFYLAEEQDLKLIEVVKAVDGDRIFKDCILGIHECEDKHPCPIHHEYVKIREEITTMLENSSIKEIARDLDQGLAFLKI